MLHGDNDLGGAGVADKIHGTAETLDLTRQHPVRKVTGGADLHGTQDSKVDAATADHAEALLAAKDGGTGLERDRLLARVDEVGIFLALLGIGSQTQNAVLGLELDLNLGANEARSEHRHADAEVGVHAVLELLGGTSDNELTLGGSVAAAERLLGIGVVLILGEGVLLNVLLGGALDDSFDIDTGQVDGLRGDLTRLNNVLSLDNGHLGVATHGAVEVVGGETELAVSELVSLVGLDKSVVTGNALLEEVGLSIEDLDVLGVGKLVGGAIGLVPEREFTGLHDSAEGGGGVEGGNALAASSAALGEGALRGELELDLTGKVHLLKGLVLANVAGNHLLDLLGLEQLAKAGSVGAGIVGDRSKAGDLGLLENLVDQGIGNTTEAETAAQKRGV